MKSLNLTRAAATAISLLGAVPAVAEDIETHGARIMQEYDVGGISTLELSSITNIELQGYLEGLLSNPSASFSLGGVWGIVNAGFAEVMSGQIGELGKAYQQCAAQTIEFPMANLSAISPTPNQLHERRQADACMKYILGR